MIKKVMCLMAVMVLAAACSDDGTNGGKTGMNGANGYGANGAGGNTQQDIFARDVGDRVFFDFNQSDLNPEARATLDKQAAWLKKNNVNVTVEGHCDERGTREYNLALGERRATAAKNYLVADGIPASRIKTISYGKERPAVLGSNEQSWAQNRRDVTLITQ